MLRLNGSSSRWCLNQNSQRALAVYQSNAVYLQYMHIEPSRGISEGLPTKSYQETRVFCLEDVSIMHEINAVVAARL